jgi:hypothetical protein
VTLVKLLDEVLTLPLDEAQRHGSGLARVLGRLVFAQADAAELWTRFALAAARAREVPSPETVLEFTHALTSLEKRGGQVLTGDELRLLRDELEQHARVVAARAASVGVPMPDYARFRRLLSDANRTALLVHTARYQDDFVRRLRILAGGTPNSSEALAIATYRRMLAVVGDQADEGWSRVFTYCAQNRPGITRAAMVLRAAVDAHAAAPTAATAAALRLARRNSGYLYPIRGELAEIYVHYWPAWRVQRASAIELGTATARRLGRGWTVQPFAGGALIDGGKAWDEGVLLLKPPSPADRIPRAVLQTAAQVKVQRRVESLRQTIRDRARERGAGGASPLLTLLEGNRRRDFLLEPLPAGEEVIRYVFHAQLGELSAAEVARLRAAFIEVTAQPLPLSVDEFDALALEIMFAAL